MAHWRHTWGQKIAIFDKRQQQSFKNKIFKIIFLFVGGFCDVLIP
jgi:hypothetical protein